VELRNCWLPAQVKVGTFYGHFNSGFEYQLGGFFYWLWICMCSVSYMSWSTYPFWGSKQFWQHFVYQHCGKLWHPVPPPQGAGMQIYNSFPECRAQSALMGMGYSLIGHLHSQAQQVPALRQVPKCCWGEGQWLIWLLCAGNGMTGVGVVALNSGVDPRTLQRSP
jgi:hypothetical protein